MIGGNIMKIILCLDERDGMAFNKRRQSSDARVSEDIVRTAGGRLVIFPYSEKLISEIGECRVSENALCEAREGDYVFVETASVDEQLRNAEGLIIYRWNRHYPSSLKLSVKPEDVGFRLVSTSDFVGNSHEKITKEIYER